MSEHQAKDFAGTGVSGGPTGRDAAPQPIERHRLDGEPPRLARGWLAGRARAVAERVVPRHRAHRRTREALEVRPLPAVARHRDMSAEQTERRGCTPAMLVGEAGRG